ncbi:hypothetical protein P5673_022672, partial [Acropora cervicornis]
KIKIGSRSGFKGGKATLNFSYFILEIKRKWQAGLHRLKGEGKFLNYFEDDEDRTKDLQSGCKYGEWTYQQKLFGLFFFTTFYNLYFLCSTNTVYAADRDDEKPNCVSRRDKGCFASKRRVQSVKNLARAQQCRTEVNENHPEEEIDLEPPRKIETKSQQTKHEDNICGTRLIEPQVLRSDLKISCSSCKEGPLSLVNIIGEKQSGLGSIFSVTCSHCGQVNEVKFSGEHRAGNRGPLVSDINTRAVLGSLHAGMGNTHLNNLLSTMNIPTMNHCLFKRREREVGKAMEIVARESCEMNLNLEKKVSEQLSGPSTDGLAGIAVSYDMQWQKRGREHNSSTGHVVSFAAVIRVVR